MRKPALFLILFGMLLVGCRPSDERQSPPPGSPSTANDAIKNIQNDPKMPDGLKRIQTETLRHQPGVAKGN